MKIVCSQSSTMPNDIMRGYANAFNTLGHDFIFWNSRLTPIFDIFDRHRPDLFIASINDVTRGVASVLMENPNTITMFHSHSFKNISEESIDSVKQLKQDTGKPDFIFSLISLHDLQDWKNMGFKPVWVHAACDNTLFYPEDINPLWMSDVVYCGNYDQKIEEYILPLCNNDFKFRIYGTGWDVANCVGQVKVENLRKIFSSSKIVLNVVPEEDIITDIEYNAAACGTLCATNSPYTNYAHINHFWKPPYVAEKIGTYLERLEKNGKPSFSKYPIVSYTDRIPKLLKEINLE